VAGCPDAVLLLVGDGPGRRRLERLAAHAGVRESVVLTGGVPWEEVPAYTDAGDVFAMPCRTRRMGLEPEAWGIVSLEAQACGLPVLIGRSGGAPETLSRGVPGLVADPPDRPDLVAGALLALLEKAPPRTVRSGAVRWTWTGASARLRQLLEASLAGGG
jgi:phosphatidylinositol alpha-1,6-mannosyltransferase